MSIFSRLFGTGNQTSAPDIPFGRYTDAYKTDAQQKAFDRSLELFDEGKHMDAYREFMLYLKDAHTDNIEWHEKGDVLEFHFWQGSQRISGTASTEKVKAESRIARAEDLNVGFLRRLMEANFNLKFSRFALAPQNVLTILFDTHVTDGSPYKLLYALRELAIHADKQDDLLLDEFKTLRPAQERTFGEIPEVEKETKYRFLNTKVAEAFAEMDKAKPDPNTYPGTFAYMLLALAFKLDYLIRPEGFMMDALERVHGIYFAKNDRTPQIKVTGIRKEFQKLLDRPKEALFSEMYRTRSTFGINPAVSHDSIVSLIDGELPNMEWPLQQNYEALALAVPQYIAGFALFHYAPPKPDRELFHLFYQIMEPAFFRELGFDIPYVDAGGRLNRNEIIKAVKTIAERNRAVYPQLRPQPERLDFASPVLFSRSFLLMMKELNMTKEI